jgi:hypothetical protein
MRKKLATIAAVVAVAMGAVASGGPAAADTAEWAPLAPASEPEVNPLKGFIPFQGAYDNFPHSMEWAYFPVDSVMTGPDAFDWSVMDSALDDIASRGHQTALRFYLDYPGRPSGIPQYLIDGGLETRSYDDYGNGGQSVSPDYDDPNLRDALGDFIAALGARYDGDPRVGFVQAGLVGFWGEWHTYPYNGENGNPDWMPSSSTQQEILDAYVQAFGATQLMVRNPNTMNASMPIGYHDDSFALSTKASSVGWHFMDLMIAAGATDKWQQYAIGGELRPELQSCIFSSGGCPVIDPSGDNDFPGSVEQTHASWLINHYAFGTGYSSADEPAALAGAQSLGYSFRVTEALVPTEASGDTAEVGLRIANIGVAPFYYDWPIELALVDAGGDIAATVATDWRVGDIPSGGSAEFTTSLDVGGLPGGTYTLAAQVPNPMSGGVPVRFANAAQDADEDGWLTLGTTTVEGAPACS